MRIKELNLKAVGPFTNRIISFSTTSPGLHIVFGANEAGKSSSLRALQSLLFGFHRSSPDNFLHSYKNLLVGGLLENKNGDSLYFYRCKGSKNDLLDIDLNPLAPEELNRFLHGMDQDVFKSAYGLDHAALMRGGEGNTGSKRGGRAVPVCRRCGDIFSQASDCRAWRRGRLSVQAKGQ